MNRYSLVHSCVVALTFLSYGCQTKPKATFKDVSISQIGTNAYVAFVPMDPLPSPMATFHDNSGSLVSKPWSGMSGDEIRRLLPNQRAAISVAKRDQSGSLKYLVAESTAEAGTYQIIMDYMNFKVETVIDPSTRKELGLGRVGVGMRITASIVTKKAGINLSSLFALGIAASQGILDGSLVVDTIGMQSNEIAALFPTPSKIDETGIQKTFEALAAIRSKLGDKSTNLTPHILAVKSSAPDVQGEKVKQLLQVGSQIGFSARTKLMIGEESVAQADGILFLNTTANSGQLRVYVLDENGKESAIRTDWLSNGASAQLPIKKGEKFRSERRNGKEGGSLFFTGFEMK